MRKIILKTFIFLLNIIYFFIKLLPTKNKIVMISRQSNEINLDFRLLKKELEDKYKVVVMCKTLPGGTKAKFSDKISYGIHMFRHMYHIATSKVCVLDSYCPTISILKHKKNLTIIQMWHSIGTMKKFGYSSLGKKEGNNKEIAKIMKMHQNYDVVYCASDAYKKHLAKGFNIPEDKIKIFTLPRVDLLKDKLYESETKDKIYAKYPELKQKENVLYAPTFRKDEKELNEKINELIANFNFEKYNLIIKLHPLSKVKISNSRVIMDYNFSTFDMLFVADKLISDYSCIVYEAGIKNIPLYFYCFDYKKYINNVGLAIDFKRLPGYNEERTLELIQDLEKSYNLKAEKKFINKYVLNTDFCAKKMAEDIASYM